MKSYSRHIIVLGILLMASVASFGQEGSGFHESPAESDKEAYDHDRVLMSPGEGETHYPSRTLGVGGSAKEVAKDQQRDADLKAPKSKIEPVQIKPVDKAQSVAPKENPDVNVQSFNFLYYIIQKYKLQDIVD